MDPWQRDEVVNAVRARSRNEWIEETSSRVGFLPLMEQYVCECSFGACASLIRLTRDEYEGVRRDGTFFAIAVDHENPEIDRVIGENERFALIDVWFGEPSMIARATDPRRFRRPPHLAREVVTR